MTSLFWQRVSLKNKEVPVCSLGGNKNKQNIQKNLSVLVVVKDNSPPTPKSRKYVMIYYMKWRCLEMNTWRGLSDILYIAHQLNTAEVTLLHCPILALSKSSHRCEIAVVTTDWLKWEFESLLMWLALSDVPVLEVKQNEH